MFAASTDVRYHHLPYAPNTFDALPDDRTIVIERFRDELGDWRICILSPFGGRVNRGLGLALRKKFCRTFNFELQAAATDDAVILSLGPHHSFPLADVPRFLHSNTVRGVLEQTTQLPIGSGPYRLERGGDVVRLLTVEQVVDDVRRAEGLLLHLANGVEPGDPSFQPGEAVRQSDPILEIVSTDRVRVGWLSGVTVSQVLLTADDLMRRSHHQNAFRALNRLLNLGVVPVVNENDTVATEEIRGELEPCDE